MSRNSDIPDLVDVKFSGGVRLRKPRLEDGVVWEDEQREEDLTGRKRRVTEDVRFLVDPGQ